MAVASRQPFAASESTGARDVTGGSWNFAVPLGSTKSAFSDHEPPMDGLPHVQSYSSRQPLGSQPNGAQKTSRGYAVEPLSHDQSEDYALHTANEGWVGSDDPAVSRNESPDGIKEYYEAHKQNGTGKARGRNKLARKTSSGWIEAEKDQNNWIHRDKLKEIETKELAEFSQRLGRASRSQSRSQSVARAQSRGRANSELTDAMSSGDDRPEPRRMVSPIPAEDEEQDMEHTGWDLRSPAEIEAERDRFAARNNVPRPGTSRIPIAKTSPLPVPHTFVDRDQPLPRSRTNSGSWDTIAANGARVRSASMSSQLLLDEPEQGDKSPAKPNFSNPASPINVQAPKGKTPAKGGPNSRKTGGQKLAAKPRNASTGPRNTSGNSPSKRPGTSGGSVSRPTTSHRPEGEAPWIASMYKPDPRLPPDQQIIPTHAKRMQQEQWETLGRTGSIYDKEYRLLNAEESPEHDPALGPMDLAKAQADQAWPLPSPEKPTLDSLEQSSSKSPSNDQGKFKLTPTISQGPTFPQTSPRSAEQRIAPPIAPVTPKSSIRLPEPPPEAPEKEKKSCCCIVM